MLSYLLSVEVAELKEKDMPVVYVKNISHKLHPNKKLFQQR
jgi:hypothetical protein